ncbi:MAG: tRNA lysidine(34) synthetase TilS [Rickettsiales bacterium]|nr:tRNA lysidine(34) synthetase TilS [Rickettsiales bacterium]
MAAEQLAVAFSFHRVAIAVSGGADSMALLLLASEWAKENKTAIAALTVDHGLRPESAAEATQVAHWCSQLGINHHIISAKDSGFRINGKQEDARNARYALLVDWCKIHGYPALATGHHRGDQAETLFFRLGRGSSLLGLSSIAPSSTLNEIMLLRPLLDVPKSALTEYLHSKNQSWIEDPSNQNPRYARNLLRRHLHKHEDYNALEERAAKLAIFFSRMRFLVEQQVTKALNVCVSTDESQVVLRHHLFRDLPSETAKLMLGKLITMLNDDDHPPRSTKLDHLLSQLREEHFRAGELAGLRFVRTGSDTIKITREHLKKAAKVPYSLA